MTVEVVMVSDLEDLEECLFITVNILDQAIEKVNGKFELFLTIR
jgi:hypothetical protein